MRVTLKEAERFHGHLGPYLVLGILAGEIALKKLGCKKYFGLRVEVRGANHKPRSCLIDGLQLSSGATYGKGNIRKFSGKNLEVLAVNQENKKKIKVSLKKDLLNRLNNLKGHKDSEAFAKSLFKAGPAKLFNLTTHNS